MEKKYVLTKEYMMDGQHDEIVVEVYSNHDQATNAYEAAIESEMESDWWTSRTGNGCRIDVHERFNSIWQEWEANCMNDDFIVITLQEKEVK